MPTYKFKDTNTGKVFDEFMSFSERETYLKAHSNITQVPVMFAYTGDHIMGVGPKNYEGFKERMSQIASAHPNSHLADRYKTNESHKSLKTKAMVRKHQKKNPLVTK